MTGAPLARLRFGVKTNNVLLLSARVSCNHSPEPIHFQRLVIKDDVVGRDRHAESQRPDARVSILIGPIDNPAPLFRELFGQGGARPTIANYPGTAIYVIRCSTKRTYSFAMLQSSPSRRSASSL